MAVPACRRICCLVKLTISEAMSVSRMRDSDAERFSTDTCRLLMTDSKRFWNAPRLARVVDTVEMAESMAASADDADAMLPMPSADTPSAEALSDAPSDTVRYSPAFAP